MSPPSTPDELALVREAGERYARLIVRLRLARDEMNEYLKVARP
jgi:hypothetical protein